MRGIARARGSRLPLRFHRMDVHGFPVCIWTGIDCWGFVSSDGIHTLMDSPQLANRYSFDAMASDKSLKGPIRIFQETRAIRRSDDHVRYCTALRETDAYAEPHSIRCDTFLQLNLFYSALYIPTTGPLPRDGLAVVMETEDLGLRRLFRPSIAHLSVKEQLKLCPPRDLGKTKLYRTAAKIWGSPKRTRVLVARSEPEKEIRVNETAKTIAVTPEKSTKVTEKDEIGEYRQWMEERRKLRGDLDSLGLSETWLRSKRNKTETEKRVLEQMMRRVSITEEPEKKARKKRA